MAGTKKLTLKNLSEELKIVKEQAEQISVLNGRISKLEKIIDDMKQNQNTSREIIECRKCDKKFQSKTNLKEHVSEAHPRSINCKTCKDSFTRICDLEVHIKTKHEAFQDYKCDHCDKTFVLKWRLQKHEKNHTRTALKKCHYFNNNIACPFEDLGCMFSHELSGACRFDRKCPTKLCSYQHTKSSEHNFDVIETVDVVQGEDEAEEDMDDNKCHLCNKTFESIDDITQHMESDHMDHFLAMVGQNIQT